jgi:hypothetical protein
LLDQLPRGHAALCHGVAHVANAGLDDRKSRCGALLTRLCRQQRQRDGESGGSDDGPHDGDYRLIQRS